MGAEVRAEIVANVMSVFVAEGASVVAGDTLVMLESMKMEIPVLTDVSGTVRRVAVSVGSVVKRGELIAVID